MKISNLSLPHPVLGISDDVTGIYSVDCQVGLTRDEITLLLKQNLSNKTLEKLISDGSAVFNAEVHSMQTVFRKSFIFTQKEYSIKIPSVELRNKVEVNFYINAEKDISEYRIDGANPDYKSYVFEINKGDILAYGGFVSFIAEKDWQAFMAVTSFLEIEESDIEEGPTQFYLTPDKVIVRLSKKDYDSYIKYKNVQNLYPIFHSSIAFPALMYALMNMREGNSEYSTSQWFQILQTRMKTEKEFSGFELDRLDHIPKIAEEFLKNPVARSLVGIENIQKHLITEE